MSILHFLLLHTSNCDAAEPWQIGFQDPATPIMQGIIDLHHDIFFFLILIFVFVSWILGRALYHFHHRKHPIPRRIVHGTTFDSYMIPEDDLEVGQLRLLEVDNRVVFPEKTHLRMILTSADVLHSWAVPSSGLSSCSSNEGPTSSDSVQEPLRKDPSQSLLISNILFFLLLSYFAVFVIQDHGIAYCMDRSLEEGPTSSDEVDGILANLTRVTEQASPNSRAFLRDLMEHQPTIAPPLRRPPEYYRAALESLAAWEQEHARIDAQGELIFRRCDAIEEQIITSAIPLLEQRGIHVPPSEVRHAVSHVLSDVREDCHFDTVLGAFQERRRGLGSGPGSRHKDILPAIIEYLR